MEQKGGNREVKSKVIPATDCLLQSRPTQGALFCTHLGGTSIPQRRRPPSDARWPAGKRLLIAQARFWIHLGMIFELQEAGWRKDNSFYQISHKKLFGSSWDLETSRGKRRKRMWIIPLFAFDDSWWFRDIWKELKGYSVEHDVYLTVVCNQAYTPLQSVPDSSPFYDIGELFGSAFEFQWVITDSLQTVLYSEILYLEIAPSVDIYE